MKTILLSIAAFVLFGACNKDNDIIDIQNDISGSYQGTFQRSSMNLVNVSLNLNFGTYEGLSDQPDYPLICSGSYSITGNSIKFTDSCIWTPTTDRTLILDGIYNINSSTDNEIRIWRTNGATTDEYFLQRRRR